MFTTPLESRIRELVDPTLGAMGYALVQLKLRDGKPRVLEIMAERADAQGMSLVDCTMISQTVSALMDVEDPISSAYQLEVCSPGLDRPLCSRADFERFMGREVRIETMLPIEDSKRMRGALVSLGENEIVIRLPQGERHVPLNNIRMAKLVPADEVKQALRDDKKRRQEKKSG